MRTLREARSDPDRTCPLDGTLGRPLRLPTLKILGFFQWPMHGICGGIPKAQACFDRPSFLRGQKPRMKMRGWGICNTRIHTVNPITSLPPAGSCWPDKKCRHRLNTHPFLSTNYYDPDTVSGWEPYPKMKTAIQSLKINGRRKDGINGLSGGMEPMARNMVRSLKHEKRQTVIQWSCKVRC